MYDVVIYNDGLSITVHNHRIAKRDEKLIKGIITEQENEITSFVFEITPNNPGYDQIIEFATQVKVYNSQKDRYDFIGRVLHINPETESDGFTFKEVICEGKAGYLHDSIQPYANEQQYDGDEERNGLEQFIDVVLAHHNSQVEDHKKIYRGDVTVTTFESSEGVYKGLNYEKTWDCIDKKLIDSFGGQIQIRETDDINYLDYSDSLGQLRTTSIELGRNLQSVKKERDPTSIITRLIPLGSKLSETVTDENGNESSQETEERLTISDVNGGLIYIQDDIAYSKYGAIYGVAEWDDVTEAANLLSKGQYYLANNNYVTESFKIRALDLSLIGLDIDDFKLYDSYPVINSLIALDETLQIIKKQTNIIEPQKSSIEMGDISRSIAFDIVDAANIIDNVKSTVSKVGTNALNRTNSLSTFIGETISRIDQSANEIALSVESIEESITDYETFKTIVQTQLQIDEDGAALIFDTITTLIEQVNGTVVSNQNELQEYIRFIEGDIILGNSESPFTLQIENDKISFLYNSISLGYFQPNKLFIPELIEIPVGGSFKLGNFSFIPRSNGNLSFKFVG